ncbi:MAG: VOC family protein [Candidatus Eremiobacteraeota bacterium]|nr:VOC family protein [Candidatus Eremiobacteraeota bacterium]MBV8433032.1 VOC family protein [Candidatus Eremiobacteraeota bacterium]
MQTNLKLTHLTLGVANLGISERFYGDVLGLPTKRVDDQVEIRWTDAFLLILTASPPAGRGKFHFGFRVGRPEEVDRWAERLREKGVEIVIGPSGDNGRRQLYCIDPDDYKIEIYSEASS